MGELGLLTVELCEDAVQIVLELLVCSDHERKPVHAFPFELLRGIDLTLVAALKVGRREIMMNEVSHNTAGGEIMGATKRAPGF